MDIQKRNNIISAVLILVIIGLGYWLYRSIVDPYQKVLMEKAMTQKVRTRMSNVRDVLIKYKNDKNNFPPNLDSLVVFLKTDSAMVAKGASLFDKTIGHYNPDSLIHSPRPPHHEFLYARNDTIRPQIYLLTDPDDSTNTIGSLTKTTLLNAASWE
ncbi:MAG TPA: hypothetical protein VJ991_03615 [Balneolales bacterium]|nr:hypothetical protein [Balneolales bacterium]